MGRERKYWYGYIRTTINRFPDGIDTNTDAGAKAYEAVQEAIRKTNTYGDGAERMRLLDMVCFSGTHTYWGAARELNISDRTAQRWVNDFVYIVADKMGFL